MRRWISGSFLALVGLLLGGSITHTHDAFVYELTPPIYRWIHEMEMAQPTLLGMLEPYQITPPTVVSPRIPVPAKDLQIAKGLRVMVFSPHPDDETLAAGGLVQRILKMGGKACVVFMTNGDGYLEGVRKHVRRTQTSAADFVEYGRYRHGEALEAIAALGLGPDDAIFLGFPDDGIDDLWSSNWSASMPYTSPYTRFDHPHYQESYNRWVKYAGMNLREEIVQAIHQFSPDWVVLPDVRDIHPDHYTTAIFVLDALRDLRQEGNSFYFHTQVYTYLVHYMDYPAADSWLSEFNGVGVGGTSTAGKLLSSVQWFKLGLTSDEVMGKQKALSAHQSQLLVMADFLKQFLRPNELFIRLDPAQTIGLPRECAVLIKSRSGS